MIIKDKIEYLKQVERENPNWIGQVPEYYLLAILNLIKDSYADIAEIESLKKALDMAKESLDWEIININNNDVMNSKPSPLIKPMKNLTEEVVRDKDFHELCKDFIDRIEKMGMTFMGINSSDLSDEIGTVIHQFYFILNDGDEEDYNALDQFNLELIREIAENELIDDISNTLKLIKHYDMVIVMLIASA